MHYNYFRDYDPRIGRYVESDPIGLAAGLNTYAYVGANPLALYDPEGKSGTAAGCIAGAWLGPAGCAGGAIVGTAITIVGACLLTSAIGSDSERQKALDEKCDKLNEIDTKTCNAITRRRGAAAGQACHASAGQRLGACRAGKDLPPLNTWNN